MWSVVLLEAAIRRLVVHCSHVHWIYVFMTFTIWSYHPNVAEEVTSHQTSPLHSTLTSLCEM